jgi:transposase-like protein
MNPEKQFCPNPGCPARGKVGAGNIGVHSRVEQRYRCQECWQTFSARKGTALYGLKHEEAVFVKVTTLLAHGCPVRAAALAFELDERTVQDWLARSGQHCQGVHEALVGGARLDLGQVQTDELRVKTRGGSMWMALALCVPFRLWLGGVVSRQRDLSLIRALVVMVVTVALCRPLLLAADGLRSYVRAFQEAFRSPLPRHSVGRPRLRPWDDLAIVQVVKQRGQGVLDIQRRIVQGGEPLVQRLLHQTQGGGQINTAYIERLNASFRQCFAPLTRRSRAIACLPQTLHHGMFLLGCVYNFCTDHDSLALKLYLPHSTHRWVRRTPAMAAGLTDHRWSILELLTFKVPPSPFVPPKRRGRPPKPILQEPSS